MSKKIIRVLICEPGKEPYINEEFTVTATLEYDIGFGAFASFPVTLTSKAIGKSEVYYK